MGSEGMFTLSPPCSVYVFSFVCFFSLFLFFLPSSLFPLYTSRQLNLPKRGVSLQPIFAPTVSKLPCQTHRTLGETRANITYYLRHSSPRPSVKCWLGRLSAGLNLVFLLECRFGCLSTGFRVSSANFEVLIGYILKATLMQKAPSPKLW